MGGSKGNEYKSNVLSRDTYSMRNVIMRREKKGVDCIDNSRGGCNWCHVSSSL